MTAWFARTIDDLRLMTNPTRADLEQAARGYLAFVEADAGLPRPFFPEEDREAAVSRYVEGWRERRRLVIQQLQDRDFRDGFVLSGAEIIAVKAGTAFDQLSADDRRYVLLLAGRAEVQRIDYIISSLERPDQQFAFADVADSLPVIGPGLPFLSERADAPPPVLQVPSTYAASVAALTAKFLASRKREGIGQSHHSEMKRALDWMVEALGADKDASRVEPNALRDVRDGFQRFDVRKQGRPFSFAERQTPNDEHWIAPQTSSRYWRSVQAFFRWLRDEKYILSDPADGLRAPRGSHRPPATPEPFSPEEVQAILRTPLFAGRFSRTRRTRVGSYVERDSYWWATMVGLHTGMRAGELAQLEFDDFDFSSPLPVIKVRPEGMEREDAKRVKTRSSKRDVPISSVLLRLRLQGFVDERRQAATRRSGALSHVRVFHDVPLGSGDSLSSGMTHFFSRYWKQTGVYKKRRATHVFRHTVVANLRSRSIPNDVIRDIVGHAAQTETERYGSSVRPLSERLAAIEQIDYGEDIPDLIDCLELAARSR